VGRTSRKCDPGEIKSSAPDKLYDKIYGTLSCRETYIYKSFALDKVVLGEDAEMDEAFWVIQ